MRSTQIPGLYLLHHPKKGRGVYSANDIEKGSIIEVCPVIVFSKKDLKKIHLTSLHDYYFLWGKKRRKGAIALGYGSLYNHSENPNAEFEIDLENNEIRIICSTKISTGSEITISYTNAIKKDVKLWFKIS